MSYILPNQHVFHNIYYFFIIYNMSSRAGWNSFADRIWPAGRSLKTPAVDYLQMLKAGYFSSSKHKHCHLLQKKEALPWVSTKPRSMSLFYLASRAAPSWFFRRGKNDYSLMLYLTIENVFENFGKGKCPVDPTTWLRDLLSRLVSVILKQELQTSGISSNTVDKTMLVFAKFFSVIVHHT